jgi:Domain of unknown function (DUF1876)
MKPKLAFTIAQEATQSCQVNIDTIRSGRFTTGDAIVGLTLPQHGRVLFRGVGATVRDKNDKDSPELAHALAVARSLRQLARNIETAAMQEVHARCATASPVKKMTIDELIEVSNTLDEEVGIRIAKLEADEAKREEYIRAARKLSKATIQKRREERKAAKRAQRAAKGDIILDVDVY